MNYPGLITGLPAALVAAVAGTPQGLDAVAHVYVDSRRRAATEDQELWVQIPPEVEDEGSVMGGSIRTYRFSCYVSGTSITNAKLEVWIDQLRAYFDGRQRPSSITDLLSSKIESVVLRTQDDSEDTEATFVLAVTGVERT